MSKGLSPSGRSAFGLSFSEKRGRELVAVSSWTGHGHGLDEFAVSAWTVRGHGQTAVVVADWILGWTDRDCGHCVDATRTEPQLLRGNSWTMRGCCSDVVRQRRGYCAEIAPNISPDAACPVCGNPVEIVWTFAGYSTDTVRTLRDLPPYF